MKYLRHPLLVAWLAITLALGALLIGLGGQHVASSTPAIPSSSVVAVTQLRLDFSDLGAAGLYGGASWRNIVTRIAADAKVDSTSVARAYRGDFAAFAPLTKVALTDRTTADRFSDVVALTTALNRVTLDAGLPGF